MIKKLVTLTIIFLLSFNSYGLCPSLDPIENGLVTESGFESGDVSQYYCIAGYKLVGERDRVCTDGEPDFWSGTEPSCEIGAEDGQADVAFTLIDLIKSDGLSLAEVKEIEVQDDGKILLIGDFSTADGEARDSLVRLNADGTLDTSFVPPSPLFSLRSVSAIEILASGQILVGARGSNTKSESALIRLNSDGSRDESFTANVYSSIVQLAALSTGKILLSGSVGSINELDNVRIARLNADGTTDTSFNASALTAVFSMLPLPDGRILMGGLSAVETINLTLLKQDGTVDQSFAPDFDVKGVSFTSVNSLKRVDDGSILVAGLFNLNGIGEPNIIKISDKGIVDPFFSVGIDGTAVNSLAVERDGRILVAHDIGFFNGEYRFGMSRLNSDGSVDRQFDPHAGNPISDIEVLDDDSLLIGGNIIFIQNGAVSASGLAKLKNRIEPKIELETQLVRQNEGDDLGAEFSFTVNRLLESTGNASVDFSVEGGASNAANEVDFGGVFPTGTIVFSDGEIEKTLSIQVNGDTMIEQDESFTVVLSNVSSGYELGSSRSFGQIVNDDVPPNLYSISSNDDALSEGNADSSTEFEFTVSRTGQTSIADLIDWRVDFDVVGTAANETDFQSVTGLSGQIQFASGETIKRVSILIAGDDDVELNESFRFTLPTAPVPEGNPRSYQVSILNDDFDADDDGVLDRVDNCPDVENPMQGNTDGDEEGDACDLDDDNDTVPDIIDNCQHVPNLSQEDTDEDLFGNACDIDDDNDTIPDEMDNCPLDKNSDQADANKNGIGDACEPVSDDVCIPLKVKSGGLAIICI